MVSTNAFKITVSNTKTYNFQEIKWFWNKSWRFWIILVLKTYPYLKDFGLLVL
jgi:hypothetical protein